MNKGWRNFIKLCGNCKSEDELAEILRIFLTTEECENIATRVTITQQLLLTEKPQREIAKMLKVSISKITRGSNFLKTLPNKILINLKKRLDRIV